MITTYHRCAKHWGGPAVAAHYSRMMSSNSAAAPQFSLWTRQRQTIIRRKVATNFGNATLWEHAFFGCPVYTETHWPIKIEILQNSRDEQTCQKLVRISSQDQGRALPIYTWNKRFFGILSYINLTRICRGLKSTASSRMKSTINTFFFEHPHAQYRFKWRA